MPFPKDWTVDRIYPQLHIDRKFPLPLPSLSPQEHQLLTIPPQDEIMVLAAESEYRMTAPYIILMLDVRLRRFYAVLADHAPEEEVYVLEDPYWANTLVSTNHRIRDDFNLINVDSDNGDMSLELLPEERVAWSLRHLKPPPSHPDVPLVPFTALCDRKYLEFTVETCTWNGLSCVFKQPLVNGHVEMMHKEVDLNIQVFNSPYVVPLAAFIVDDDGLLRGQLYPWSGAPIDTLPSLTWHMLRDVLCGLRDIGMATVTDGNGVSIPATHGDIFARNVLVQDGRARLIDAGNEGCNYEGDRGAAITMFSSLQDKMATKDDEYHLEIMLNLLKTDLPFEEVVKMLCTPNLLPRTRPSHESDST